MHCSKCSTENPRQARFCMNCAAPLVLVCAECGTELPPAARFCFHCAAPVAEGRGAAEGEPGLAVLDGAIHRLVPTEYAQRLLATRGQVVKERRIVTILFSDVKGSTAMAEGLDPEDWTEIMESAGQPGTALITEDTHKLIAPLFETEALGPIGVKGKAQPVPVYRVLAAKELPGKVRGIAGRLPEAIEHGQQSLAAAEKIGLQPYIWRAWAVLTVAHSLAGHTEEAAECMEQGLAEVDGGIRFQYALACVYAQLGQRDEALAILRPTVSQMDDGLQAWAQRDPDLAGLRDDPQLRCLWHRHESDETVMEG